MATLHQKRAISEREKFIKEENVSILWSNPSNVDISSFTTPKKAISEREEFIKEENLSILWSNPSNVDISLLWLDYGNSVSSL